MSGTTTAAPRQRVGELISVLWWLPLVRGVCLIAMGGYALLLPGMTIAALTQVLGIFFIADGVLAILAGILGVVPSRVWTIVRGVLAILIGIFVFANPALVAGITATALIYMLAFSAIVLGGLEIFAAIRDRNEIIGEGWLILSGVLTIAFGILLLISPLSFGLLMVRIVGVFAIVFGVSLITFAFRLRSIGKRLKE